MRSFHPVVGPCQVHLCGWVLSSCSPSLYTRPFTTKWGLFTPWWDRVKFISVGGSFLRVARAFIQGLSLPYEVFSPHDGTLTSASPSVGWFEGGLRRLWLQTFRNGRPVAHPVHHAVFMLVWVELWHRLCLNSEPLDRPENFELDNSTLTSTSADFTWDAVDQSVERVRGYFRGYQVLSPVLIYKLHVQCESKSSPSP